MDCTASLHACLSSVTTSQFTWRQRSPPYSQQHVYKLHHTSHNSHSSSHTFSNAGSGSSHSFFTFVNLESPPLCVSTPPSSPLLRVRHLPTQSSTPTRRSRRYARQLNTYPHMSLTLRRFPLTAPTLRHLPTLLTMFTVTSQHTPPRSLPQSPSRRSPRRHPPSRSKPKMTASRSAVPSVLISLPAPRVVSPAR